MQRFIHKSQGNQPPLQLCIASLFLLSLCWFFLILPTSTFAQQAFNEVNIDEALLNDAILKEVNHYRKKVGADPLNAEPALSAAANDHAAYMLEKRKLTHFQRKSVKKTPKNRVDVYGRLFDRVGENVQLNNLNRDADPKRKNRPRIDSYEKLAEQLVLAWKNSPPHYKNMIDPDYRSTYTAIRIGENGEIYACQLFGGSKYQDRYKAFRDTVDFRPSRPRRCWRCKIRPPEGIVSVLADSTIVFEFDAPLFGPFVVPPILHSRMRFFNPWRDGLAADILVKSQYPCDSLSHFNGQDNVRGIVLEPVYKKDYMGIGYYRTHVVLGKVPSYIQEEFEVNLVVIQNKRPCSNTQFWEIPSQFHVDIPLSYDFDPADKALKSKLFDTLNLRLNFNKSEIIPRDSLTDQLLSFVQANNKELRKVEIRGFASIEGTKEANAILHQNRANYLVNELQKSGIDSTKIQVFTAENFVDFRRDIAGTAYAWMDTLDDTALKEKLNDKTLSNELEFLLQNHRYVDVNMLVRKEIESAYDKELVNAKLTAALANGNLASSIALQKIQYGLLLQGEMSFDDIDEVEIAPTKKNAVLLHNRLIMKYADQDTSVETLQAFRSELWQVRALNKRDKHVNTSLAIIDYYLYELREYHNKKVTFYDSIRTWKRLDEKQRARILLNASAQNDWGRFGRTHKAVSRHYWYPKVKSYVKRAKLDVDKTFEIASYFSFFRKHKYAYSLVKGKIDDTKDPHDFIFFLKLIHLTDLRLPRQTYLKYFKKIRQYSGEEFCTFFNNPNLNFQILDDPDIKKIYCQSCGTTQAVGE